MLEWSAFRRHSDIGNGDFSLICVEAPIENVAPILVSMIDSAVHHVAIDRFPASVDRGSFPHFVFEIEEQGWTTIVHAMGSVPRAFWSEGEALARRLQEGHGWRSVYCREDDTSCEFELRIFDASPAPQPWQHDPGLLRRLGIALPGIDPYDEAGLALIAIKSDRVRRVDAIERRAES